MGSQCRILVIDGDDSIREFITMALEAEGYEVYVASNKQAAIEQITDYTPQLVILDMHMNLNEIIMFSDLCHHQVGQYISVIGLSTSNKATELAEQSGVDTFLPKPFDLDDLLELCERFASVIPKE